MTEQEFNALKSRTVAALYQVGKCLETGDGIGKDEAEAVKWYRMAAEQEFAPAQFELGKCYSFGIGVRRNRATAAKWIRKAADQRHTEAMLIFGIRCRSGCGIEESPREAVKWFRRAAGRGDARAMFELGECYENGDGVKKDLDAAFLWFCRAALAAPQDEHLYQMVQSRIFAPELKEVLGKKHSRQAVSGSAQLAPALFFSCREALLQ